jgi:hypothetical protein
VEELKAMLGFIVGGLLTLLIFSAILQVFGFASFSFYAPKVVAVQTKVFHESQAYTDGMTNDLADLRIRYMTEKDPDAKDAIRALIVERFKGYDRTKLSPELKDFYDGLERGTY